jgi:hypothetical protein
MTTRARLASEAKDQAHAEGAWHGQVDVNPSRDKRPAHLKTS